MQRTTKESNNKEIKKLDSKSTSTSKKIVSKAVAKKTPTKTTTKSKKVATQKIPTTSKKAKTTVSKKVTSTKKTPSKKTVNKVTKSKGKKQNSSSILEYYDLPYRYNQTMVKILAQTPKTLFVYWDISDFDRNKFIEQYGNKFFENTKPVLIIHNVTMNYTFEIEINDFANCWYFNINDEKCEYIVELGRRPKEYNNSNIPNDYLYITSSNKIESPNGHILFEKKQNIIFFRNVKNNDTFSKNIAHLGFIKYFGKTYNIYDMYKKIYKEDEILDTNNPTSTFK